MTDQGKWGPEAPSPPILEEKLERPEEYVDFLLDVEPIVTQQLIDLHNATHIHKAWVCIPDPYYMVCMREDGSFDDGRFCLTDSKGVFWDYVVDYHPRDDHSLTAVNLGPSEPWSRRRTRR